MEKLKIRKSSLNGKVKLSGAKNSALRLLAASLLTDQEIILDNFPVNLADSITHIEMLEKLGKKVDIKGDQIIITGATEKTELEWSGRLIRNNLLVWGSLYARMKNSIVPMPGGCNIGDRKHDLHIMILEKFGAEVIDEGDKLIAKQKNDFLGCDIHLPIRSTGATENSILLATLAKGVTNIYNPHIRPEILDLVDMLTKMGAIIEVYGTEKIVVTGVDSLSSVKHRVIPDNMEAITYLVAAAITSSEIEIENFPFEHLEIPLIFLKHSGLKLFRSENSLIVRGEKCYPLEISTGPYPGINSDMQPILAVFACVARGKSVIVDLRFKGRYEYSSELNKLGANTRIEGDTLIIEGGQKFTGTQVYANDLRAGAALLLAGLISEGETIIENAFQITRGYECIVEKLTVLGVNIEWIK
jgi:UDP-N-acetylglucosamine 1-carboxyvinyltransferase